MFGLLERNLERLLLLLKKFKDIEAVKAEIERCQPKEHYILIKGSNGTKLYELPELL